MSRCWAYQPVAGSKTAWVPCVREAEEGSRFCGRHGAAITGAMLGMLERLEGRMTSRMSGRMSGRRRGQAEKERKEVS